jgi:hypothetical protein
MEGRRVVSAADPLRSLISHHENIWAERRFSSTVIGLGFARSLIVSVDFVVTNYK